MRALEAIRHRAGIRRSLSNIGWLSGDRILRLFGALVVNVLVTRYLGPSNFGLLNYAIAVAGIVNMISNLGLDGIVVRDLVLDGAGEEQILGTAFTLKAAAAVATGILALGVALLLDPHNRTLFIMVGLISAAAIFQALDVIEFFFQSHTRSKLSVVPRTIVFITGSIARVIAVFLHMPLLVFAWIVALEIVLAEIGLLISYIRFRRLWPKWVWRVSRAKTMLSESWPLLLANVMVLINMRTDQILLGKLASMETVGIHSAAVRLSEVWYAIPMIVSTSVMPRLLQSRDLNLQRYYSRLQTFYESMILLSVGVVVCTLIAGHWVVNLLYGKQYAAAAGILSVHIWTGIFVAVGCIGGHQYVHEKVTISSINRAGLGAVVNFVLNILWIPRWGGMGSAMATLVSYSISSYFGDALDRRTRGIFRMKTRAYLRFWMLPRLIFKKPTNEFS